MPHLWMSPLEPDRSGWPPGATRPAGIPTVPCPGGRSSVARPMTGPAADRPSDRSRPDGWRCPPARAVAGAPRYPTTAAARRAAEWAGGPAALPGRPASRLDGPGGPDSGPRAGVVSDSRPKTTADHRAPPRPAERRAASSAATRGPERPRPSGPKPPPAAATHLGAPRHLFRPPAIDIARRVQPGRRPARASRTPGSWGRRSRPRRRRERQALPATTPLIQEQAQRPRHPYRARRQPPASPGPRTGHAGVPTRLLPGPRSPCGRPSPCPTSLPPIGLRRPRPHTAAAPRAPSSTRSAALPRFCGDLACQSAHTHTRPWAVAFSTPGTHC